MKKGEIGLCTLTTKKHGDTTFRNYGKYIIGEAITSSHCKVIYSSDANAREFVIGSVHTINGFSKIANNMEEFLEMEDFEDSIPVKEVIKEVKVEVPMYKDRVVHKHTYVEKFSETWIDKIYSWYSSLKGRDFAEEYTETEVIN